MNYFPSPPTSPTMMNKAICGSCEKALDSSWYCADCHTKCNTCNRFLSQHDYCTRCWSFDICTNRYIRKENPFYSSTNSSSTSLPL